VNWLRWVFWFCTAAYWGAIFTLTHLPPAQVNQLPHFWDKAEHGLAYFMLSLLLGGSLMMAFPHHRRIPVWVLLIGWTYGLVDELLQMLPMVHRDAELLDWVADACGVWAGVTILWLIRRSFFPPQPREIPQA
jgi:VanZ family protein